MSNPPFGRFPLNNTTPFTFRDSYTFLELLNEFLETVDTVEKNEIEFKKAVNAALAEGKKAADDFMADMTTKYQTILSQLIGYTIEVGEDTYRASMMDGSVFEAYTITGVDNKLLIVNNSLAEAAEFNAQTYVPVQDNVINIGPGSLAKHDQVVAADGGIVGIGRMALADCVSGDKSVAIGSNAMRLSSMVHDDIAIGDSALRNVQADSTVYSSSGDGTRNIAIGGNAGRHVINGTQHTFVGRNAGQNVQGGAGAVAIGNGAQAGRCPVGLTSSVENWAPVSAGSASTVNIVAVGNWAASRNTAIDCTAIGAYALSNNVKAFGNTAIGANSLRRIDEDRWLNDCLYVDKGNITGTYTQVGNQLTLDIVSHGMKVGDTAIFRLIGGESATFSAGDFAFAQVTGVLSANRFTVSHPYARNTNGTAIFQGYASAGTEGDHTNNNNTAVGSTTGPFLVKDAGNNVLVGQGAAMNLTSGGNNTILGQNALASGGIVGTNYNSNINDTTAIGQGTLFNLKTNSQGNTTVGFRAGFNLENGSDNAMLGKNAGSLAVSGNRADGFSNCTVLGANSRISGDNQVQLGGVDTNPYAYAALQIRSDKRDKTDIRDTALGLDFINSLRPVDYRFDYREKYEDGKRDGSKAGKRVHHGFIAQEVMDNAVAFGGVQDHSVNGGEDVMSIGYEEFVAPLVKAVQQLSAEVTRLSALVNE